MEKNGMSEALADQYKDYYSDGRVDAKRRLTAKLVFQRLRALAMQPSFERVLDVGCGEGSLLAEFSRSCLGTELYGLEISQSGVDRVLERNLPNLCNVRLFDGYSIPYPDKHFDLAVATHVLEHVEHERRLISELARVSHQFFIEVPLEDGRTLSRAMEIGKQYGHINFYSSERFIGLLRTTAGVANVVRYAVYPAGLEYERFLSGAVQGTLKHVLRSSLLKVMPGIAERNLTYMLGAVCKSQQ
jgi:SAM-dependent methyltransferase